MFLVPWKKLNEFFDFFEQISQRILGRKFQKKLFLQSGFTKGCIIEIVLAARTGKWDKCFIEH